MKQNKPRKIATWIDGSLNEYRVISSNPSRGRVPIFIIERKCKDELGDDSWRSCVSIDDGKGLFWDLLRIIESGKYEIVKKQ